MKFNMQIRDDPVKLCNTIFRREKLEKQVSSAVTSEILSKLKISIETLPQKSQHMLQHIASTQSELDIDKLDSFTLSLRQSKGQSEQLEEEYEILKLKQKNAELQVKIDRNKKFLEDLRKELALSKESLANQDPNPENIHDYIRQMKQKVASYEESYAKSKVNFSKLSVPESIHLMSLESLIAKRDELQHEAESLRLRADEVALVKQAREAFSRLRK